MRVSGILLAGLLSGVALMAQADGGETAVPPPTGFLNKEADWNGAPRHYVTYVPREYDAAKSWPLIVFLHGAGERGDDGLIQSEVGIGEAIRRNAERFPAIVVFPQCPADRFWDAILDHLDAVIADTRATYNIDPKRITLTGLSMGGYGAWVWGATKTDLFAAIMPICGGGKPEDMGRLAKDADFSVFGTLPERVEKLVTVPIWAFHGLDDDVVPPLRTKMMVDLVKREGGDVKHTEFRDTGHNSWDKAYGSANVIRWLLKQEKP